MTITKDAEPIEFIAFDWCGFADRYGHAWHTNVFEDGMCVKMPDRGV